MKEYKIHMNLRKVLEDVSQSSAYVGAKSSDYERVGVLEDDEAFLIKLAEASSLELVSALKGVVSNSWDIEFTAGNYQFTIGVMLPDAFPEILSEELSRHTHSFFVNDILAKWLLTMSRADASYYKQQEEMELRALREKVYSREKPKREWFKRKS